MTCTSRRAWVTGRPWTRTITGTSKFCRSLAPRPSLTPSKRFITRRCRRRARPSGCGKLQLKCERAVVACVLLLGIGAVSVESAPQPATFYRDVLPILEQHCQSCHRPGEIAPFSLVTYKETKPWALPILGSIRNGKMPPWFADPCCGHFANDPSLSRKQIETIT